MAGYKVKPGSIFGRIGSNIGKGLAEEIPKEVERNRLRQGIDELENEQGLSEFQKLGRLASLPGTSPQLIQSGGELLRQSAKSKAFNQPAPSKPPPAFPESKPSPASSVNGEKPAPSLPTEETSKKTQEGFIPKSREEIVEDARQKYKGNEAFYQNDPNKAIEESEKAETQREKIATAYQQKHENLSKIQDNVVNRLKGHSDQLGVDIPANVYSKIEDKAIQATKPKDQGGEGLTEQQAMKKYGQELDDVSRQYSGIEALGNWGITGRKANETQRSIKSLQNEFDKRDDNENMADTMIATNKISPDLAYSMAYPVSKAPEINNILKNTPDIRFKITSRPAVYSEQETAKVAKKMAPLFKDNPKASPLAVAYELEKKGYNPSTFLDYLVENRDEFNFHRNQDRQLDKPRNAIPTLNDFWLESWSGMGK